MDYESDCQSPTPQLEESDFRSGAPEFQDARVNLSHFFGLTLDLLCVASFDGYFKRLNPAWEKTLGFRRAELLARRYIDLVHPDDRAATLAAARELTTGAPLVAFENRYRCKDGSYRWLLWNAVPAAQQRLIYAAARDISEHKQVEAELRESTARYRSLVEGVPVGIYRSTPAGQILDVNPALIDMLGYPDRESLLAMNAADLYADPAERGRWQETVEREDGVQSHEPRLRRRDGRIIWIRDTAHIVRDADGRVLHYEGIWEDITQQKQAIEELSKLSSAVEQTADPVIITRVDGTIEFINAAFEKVTGFCAHEVIGNTPRILKSGTHSQEFYRHLWNTILAGQSWRGTLVNRRKNGETYFAEASIAPIFSPQGQIAHFVSVERDITERRRAERSLQEYKEREWRAAQEMEIAKQVQKRLLPQTARTLETLEYAGACTQARALGGDYYDFLALGPARVGLVAADVSGKALPAALLMATLHATVHSQSPLGQSADLTETLRSVHSLIYESTDAETFIALFIGEYDDSNRRLRYANCGLNPPLIVRVDGTLEQLAGTGPVLGLLSDWECSVAEVQLGPGDILVIYTDGVQEASNDAGEEFGVARLAETVRANRHLPVSSLLSVVATAVQDFSSGKQQDDQTLILARVR